MPLPLLLLPAALLAAPAAAPLGLVVGVASAVGAMLTAGTYGIFRLVTFAKTTNPISPPPIETDGQSTNKILQALHTNLSDVQQKITASTTTLSDSAAHVRASAEVVSHASTQLITVQESTTLNVSDMQELVRELQVFDQKITEESQTFATCTERITNGITPELIKTSEEIARLKQILEQHTATTKKMAELLEKKDEAIVNGQQQITQLSTLISEKNTVIAAQKDTIHQQAVKICKLLETVSLLMKIYCDYQSRIASPENITPKNQQRI